MASIRKRPNGMWRARYRDPSGKENARHFQFKDNPRDPTNSAQHWLDQITASVVTGTYVDPRRAKTTVGDWAATWLEGYLVNRPGTVKQARVHIKIINASFERGALKDVRPSEVKVWVGLLQKIYRPSYVYALHRRLGQLFADAAHDGLVPRSPVSRCTSPPVANQRAYVATTPQIWALYDALPEHFRPVVLLGAFVGLRIAEMVALRVEDVDFLHRVVSPAIQYPGVELKTEASKTPIPIPHELALELSIVPTKLGTRHLLVGAFGRPVTPTTVEVAFKTARETIQGLPEGFRIHDLRHYYASLLISSDLDVKVVQVRLRHVSAKTSLDLYGHLWPDKDESARAAVAVVLNDRLASRADSLRTVPAGS